MAKPPPVPVLLLLACAIVLVVWFAGGTGDAPEPLTTATNEEALPSTPEHAGGGVEELAPEARRDVIASEPATPADLAMGHAFSLRVRAIDEFGLPAVGQAIRLSPLDCTRNEFEQKTDEAGYVVLQWRGRTSTMAMAVAAGSNAPREITVTSGSQRELTLLASRNGPGLRFRISNSGGQGNGSFELVLEADDEEIALGSTAKDDHIDRQKGLHQDATFADRLLGTNVSDTGIADLAVFSGFRLARSGIQLDASQFLVESTPPTAPTTGTITGLVYTEDGKPAANQMMCYGTEPDRPLQRGQCDEKGQFRFDDVLPGFVEVRAGGGAAGLARQTVQVQAGQATNATLTLRRERRIAGTAKGGDGKPLADWFVEYEALDGSWVDRTRTKPDGSYVLANLVGGAGRLLLRESTDAVPSAVVASALPDSGDVDFDLSGDKEPKGRIALRVPEPPPAEAPVAKVDESASTEASEAPVVVDSSPASISLSLPTEARAVDLSNGLKITGLLSERVLQTTAAPPTGTTVFAWQQESHLGFAIPRAEDGSFTCGKLPAGFYRIEFRSEGVGTVDLGSHWVDGKGALDLGTVRRPQSARCELENVPAGAVLELYHRRAHGDVRVHADLEGRTTVDLPAGTFVAVWRVGEDPIRSREFALRAGETTKVDLAH